MKIIFLFPSIIIHSISVFLELTVYEHTEEMIASHMSPEEIEINQWLEDRNITMADPLDLVY